MKKQLNYYQIDIQPIYDEQDLEKKKILALAELDKCLYTEKIPLFKNDITNSKNINNIDYIMTQLYLGGKGLKVINIKETK